MDQLKQLSQEVVDNLIYVHHMDCILYNIIYNDLYAELIFKVNNHNIHVSIVDINYIKYYDSLDIVDYILDLIKKLEYNHKIRLN